MAGFEGVKWAAAQMRYSLGERDFELVEAESKIYAVSRSTHYGLFLAFEGIRFFCRRGASNELELIFLNLERNLERFRRGIAFNLGSAQQPLVPTIEELTDILVHRYFGAPRMREFLAEMAELGAQGYLRPFTIDEDLSMGVTFPSKPTIRAVACRYDRYLGEPFSGVIVHDMIRAIGANGTGCLKLGINYLMSVKAVDAAKAILPGAASALFLDDRIDLPLRERRITEWDSSCCLLAMRDGTVIKVPESPLILPSVTIQGITAILKVMNVPVEERDVTYGELIEKVRAGELAAICSIGTAGILNRCDKLLLVDEDKAEIATHLVDKAHPLFETLGRARAYYWDIYRREVPAPDALKLSTFSVA
jgi:branched-subunit amino acid aminotransferase/4-amino-4-deoxychorismate lyase